MRSRLLTLSTYWIPDCSHRRFATTTSVSDTDTCDAGLSSLNNEFAYLTDHSAIACRHCKQLLMKIPVKDLHNMLPRTHVERGTAHTPNGWQHSIQVC
jgi:hypothetical protein